MIRTLALWLSVVLLTSTLAQADIVTSLRGYWKFDESSGTAADSSGNGNAGTLTSGAVFGTGKVNGGVVLNGTTAYVAVGNVTALQITGTALTLAAWVRIDGNAGGSAGDYHQVVGKDAGASYDYRLLLDNNRSVLLFQGAGVSVSSTTFTAFTLGTWHHVAAAFNGSSVAFYVDGVARGTPAGAGTLSNGGYGVAMGRTAGTNIYQFNGAIDEVRIYARVLASGDVTELVNFVDTVVARRRAIVY